MKYSKGAVLLWCLPLLAAIAMGCLAIWRHMAYQQRLLRAEKQVLEAQKEAELHFQAWVHTVEERLHPFQGSWEGRCEGSQILRCGYKFVNQENILVYVLLFDSIYRQSLLRLKKHTPLEGAQDGSLTRKNGRDHGQ